MINQLSFLDALLTTPQPNKNKKTSPVHVGNNSGNNEWYTPPEIIETARKVMGSIDLDPASNPIANQIVKAKCFYTKEQNGLEQKWFGNVWINPPYSKGDIDLFSKRIKTAAKQKEIDQFIALTNNATDTDWYLHLSAYANVICHLTGRVKFYNTELKPVGEPLQGQIITAKVNDTNKFIEQFSKHGRCFVNSNLL